MPISRTRSSTPAMATVIVSPSATETTGYSSPVAGGFGAAPHPPSSIPAAASTAPTRFRQLWRAAGGWLFTITHGNGFD